MQEVKIDRLGIILPLKFADMTLIVDLQEYLDGIRRVNSHPLDEARLTFLIQKACEDSHDPEAFNVTMRHYPDKSISYAGKCLRLHIEELADIFNGLTTVYLESLRDRKTALLEKIKGELTAAERAEVRNSIAEVEKLVKAGQQSSKEVMISYRTILLEEGPAGSTILKSGLQTNNGVNSPSALDDVVEVQTTVEQEDDRNLLSDKEIDEEIKRLMEQKKAIGRTIA